MQLEAFQKYFREVGQKECRVATLPDGGDRIPPGSYAFLEYYCVDKNCDCRRVMLVVTDERTERPLASISFGFDRDDPMRGPFLDPLNCQSAYADEFLALAQDVILQDRRYVARLERHYHMFKAALRGNDLAAPIALTPDEVRQRVAERKAAWKRLRRIQASGKKAGRRRTR